MGIPASAEDPEVAEYQGPWRPTVIAAIVAQTVAVLLIVSVAAGVLPIPGWTGGADPADPHTTAPREVTGAAPGTAGPPPTASMPDTVRPSPVGDGPPSIRIMDEQLVVSEDAIGEVHVQVIATAHNGSGAPIAVAAPASTWAVIDQAGDEVARGRFAHAFPPVVPPDGMVLLVEDLMTSFERPEELAELKVELAVEPAGRPDEVVPLEVSDVSWSRSPEAGLAVHARVSNVSAVDVSRATVGVVLRDATGEILCGVYDVAVGKIEAGASRSVVTAYPGTSPIDPELVASAEGAAAGER
jgi:hypothetical protein